MNQDLIDIEASNYAYDAMCKLQESDPRTIESAFYDAFKAGAAFTQPQWVYRKDAMPEEGDECYLAVLSSNKKFYLMQGYQYKGRWYSMTESPLDGLEVVAYQQINVPELPPLP